MKKKPSKNYYRIMMYLFMINTIVFGSLSLYKIYEDTKPEFEEGVYGTYNSKTQVLKLATKNLSLGTVDSFYLHERCHKVWFEYLSQDQRDDYERIFNTSNFTLETILETMFGNNSYLIKEEAYVREEFAYFCAAWIEGDVFPNRTMYFLPLSDLVTPDYLFDQQTFAHRNFVEGYYKDISHNCSERLSFYDAVCEEICG